MEGNQGINLRHMRRAQVSDNLPSKHSLIELWITPNAKESRHFINRIRLNKHMQKIPIKFNLFKGNRKLSIEKTLKKTINNNLENVQLTPTELNHNDTIEGTNLSQSTMIESLSKTYFISISTD